MSPLLSQFDLSHFFYFIILGIVISIALAIFIFLLTIFIAKWIFRMNEIVDLLELIASRLKPDEQEMTTEEVQSKFASKSIGKNESE